MHNLTYTERARIAYANGNIELADALDQLADYEAEVEQLTEQIREIEDKQSDDLIRVLDGAIKALRRALPHIHGDDPDAHFVGEWLDDLVAERLKP